MLARNIFRWIVQNLEIFFLGSLGLTIVLLVMWLLGAAVYPAQNTEMQRIDLAPAGAPCAPGKIWIWTPRVIQRTADDHFIELVYQPNDSIPITGTLVITISAQNSGLFLINPIDGKKTSQVTLQAANGVALTQSISVINSREPFAFSAAKPGLVDVQLACLDCCSAGNLDEPYPQATIKYKVESTWRSALQNLAGQIAPTFLLALAGAISSFFGITLNQEEKHRKEANETEKGFYRHLKEHNLSAVREDGEIVQGKAAYLSGAQVDPVICLAAIAEGDLSEENLLCFEKIQDSDAAAHALMIAALHPGEDPNWNYEKFKEMLTGFPTENISFEIRGDFDKIREEYGNTSPLQPMKWPEKLGTAFSPTLPGEGGLYSPFYCENAEKDQRFLFANPNGLFWSKHPLFQELSESNKKGMDVITGYPGTGKTAFALALGLHIFENEGVFAFYLEGTPDVSRIRNAAIWRLFDFVKTHPTYLVKLGPDERDLLAALLCSQIGKALVLAELDRISSPKDWKWLKEESAPEAQKIWGKVASGQFNLLCKSIAAELPVIAEETWFHALASCCRSLGFEQLRIVIDVTGIPDRQWFREAIVQNEQDWKLAGWNISVFVNTEAAGEFYCRGEQMFELTWNASLLREWARHRWDTLNHPTPLDNMFVKNGLDEMIQLSCENPRMFIEIWNELVALGKTGRFTRADVQKAKAKVDNP